MHCADCHGLGWYIDGAPRVPVSAGHLLHLRELYEALGDPIKIKNCTHAKDTHEPTANDLGPLGPQAD